MKRNKLDLKKLFTKDQPVNRNRQDVFPFTQQPSDNQFAVKPSNKGEEAPSDLFSRFTADIIRQDVVFTR